MKVQEILSPSFAAVSKSPCTSLVAQCRADSFIFSLESVQKASLFNPNSATFQLGKRSFLAKLKIGSYKREFFASKAAEPSDNGKLKSGVI